MAITLPEAAKLALNNGETKRAAIIRIFAESSDLLRAMPFVDITGNSYAYNVEGALPGIAFRGVNESYTASTGVINPQSEPLKIAGGELDVDTFIIKTNGPSVRSTHEAMKATKLAQSLGYTFIKGNSSTTPREFDGLETRLTGSQVISNSASANGAGLSCAKLDAAIDAVDNPTHLVMNKATRRNLNAYLRSVGSVTMSKDEFGRPVMSYGDLPILIADRNGDTAAIGADEAYTGGGTSDGSSVYVVSLGDGMLNAIQNGGMDVRDLGELQTSPLFRTRIEWFVGMTLQHPRAAARLRDVDSAVIATA
ncbi:MAG: hypothetical protein IT537_25155 [Hyphomicrobiales bacterium]|nr:hypothetical protein [Hyphomicrobiales bacterium]